MGRSEQPAWYVLRTKPRSEAVAAGHLARKEIAVYLPKLEISPACSTQKGLLAEVTEPLFPGYLFAHLTLAQDFHRAAWSPGIRNFLSFGEDLAQPVDDDVIECLRRRASGGDVLRPRAFRPGEQVTVCSGPFAGLLAIIDRPIPANGRVKILLEILKRQTRVELPVHAVERL
jgi:transcriptional antiterminator RfaH